jgi:hypothetical protein
VREGDHKATLAEYVHMYGLAVDVKIKKIKKIPQVSGTAM